MSLFIASLVLYGFGGISTIFNRSAGGGDSPARAGLALSRP